MITMYCVKCRAKKEVEDDKVMEKTMPNGRPAMESTCPTCNTKMFRIGKKPTAEPAKAA